MNEIGPVLPRQPEPGTPESFLDGTEAGRAPGRLRRRILITATLLAAAAGIAVSLIDLRHHPSSVAASRANSAVPLVTTIQVERCPMIRSLTVAGSLVARHELTVGAEASGGRIDSVLVDEGDHVTKGQVLARLDSVVLEAQVRHAQAAAQDAAAAAASAEADFRRVDGIRGTGAVSAEQVGQRRAAVESAAARLAAAQAETSELEARLGQTVLRAPADGVIVARSAEPGAIVSPGGAPLFRLIEGGAVEFDAQIPQDQLQGLSPGLKADVDLGAPTWKRPFGTGPTGESPAEDATIIGRIRSVAPTVDPQGRLGIVHIALPLDPRLRPGAFVQGRILLSFAPVLSVPLSAVLWENDESFVYVVTGGHAQRRAIQTAAAEAGRVEIHAGLAEGDHVILSAGAFLHHGMAVREVPPPSAKTADGVAPR
jgi:RND family efflux transporter MFP subunit